MRMEFRSTIFAMLMLLFALFFEARREASAATNTINFTYTNRQSLLADGWDFLARTAAGATRNTEITNSGNGPVIDYNQISHPGAIRIPLGSGDFWLSQNSSQNSLFRSLPTNWTRVELDFTFAPAQPYQQVNLALYQDDDNYIELARTHYPQVSLVKETNGYATSLTSYNVAGSNVSLRIDRDVIYGDISSYYSVDGTNWIFSGKTGQEFINPRLCVWAGASVSGSVSADIRQVRIVTSDETFTSTLYLQPLAMVFSSTVGQANTNVQRVNIYHQGPDGFNWTVTENASWLSIASSNGVAPGTCDVSVNTSGLTNGIYETTLNFTALGAVTNTLTLPVTLIINASNRVSVAKWKDDKKSAMSVWIDDSDNVMYTELNNAGFKGTYALMGPGTQASLFATYHNAGMELGSHTETHPCNPLGGEERRFQIETNLANILVSTPQTQQRLTSFAWPCGAVTTREKLWASDYFLISRGYNHNQLEDTTPKDFMDVKSFNSHEHAPFPPADLETVVDDAIAQGKWANLVFHRFNNDDGAVAYAVGKDIWVGTGGDVTRYILQRDRTILTNYSQTSSRISFDCRRLTIPASPIRSFETSFNTNDTVTFKVSVTNLPPVAGVQVNGYPVAFTVRTAGSATNLVFDALVSSTLKKVLITLSNGPVLTVTPANKTKVYLQSNPSLTGTLTGVIGGDNITATYSTTALTSSPAGDYPISAIFSDPSNRMGNYVVITNLATLTITNSNAPLTLSNLSQPYNGSARTVSVSTIPSGLTVNLTYAGSANAPTNVGSYQVIGTISDPNHQGSATNTLVISISNATVTLGNLSQTYDGLARAASATTVPTNLTVNLTYAGSASAPTNAGSYQVIGTINDANYQGSVTNTLIIATTSLSAIANNTNRMIGRSNPAFTGILSGVVPTDNITATYDSPALISSPAGNYDIVPTLVDPDSRLSNYTVTATNGVLTIVGAPQFSNITRSPAGTVQLNCILNVGRAYEFQFKHALAETEWTTFVSNYLATSPLTVITNHAGLTNFQRYYRAVDVSYP